jgi:DNA polymerase epsilon subunit 3
VNRVVKSVLADNVQVTKDARAAITRAAGIFIFYLTHCANDFCKEHKRQTIYTTDVLEALKELDFGEFEPDVEEFIEQYRRDTETKKSSQPRSKGTGDDDKGDDGDDDDKDEGDEKEEGEGDGGQEENGEDGEGDGEENDGGSAEGADAAAAPAAEEKSMTTA